MNTRTNTPSDEDAEHADRCVYLVQHGGTKEAVNRLIRKPSSSALKTTLVHLLMNNPDRLTDFLSALFEGMGSSTPKPLPEWRKTLDIIHQNIPPDLIKDLKIPGRIIKNLGDFWMFETIDAIISTFPILMKAEYNSFQLLLNFLHHSKYVLFTKLIRHADAGLTINGLVSHEMETYSGKSSLSFIEETLMLSRDEMEDTVRFLVKSGAALKEHEFDRAINWMNNHYPLRAPRIINLLSTLKLEKSIIHVATEQKPPQL